jgi:hypothetical protein
MTSIMTVSARARQLATSDASCPGDDGRHHILVMLTGADPLVDLLNIKVLGQLQSRLYFSAEA